MCGFGFTKGVQWWVAATVLDLVMTERDIPHEYKAIKEISPLRGGMLHTLINVLFDKGR